MPRRKLVEVRVTPGARSSCIEPEEEKGRTARYRIRVTAPADRGARGRAVEDRAPVGVKGEERRVLEDPFGQACWPVGTMRRGVDGWMGRFSLI